jgi:AraC-like DNA-binding protein
LKHDARSVKKTEQIEEKAPWLPPPGPPMPGIGNHAGPPHLPGGVPPFTSGRPGPPHHGPQLHRVPFLGIFTLISFISYTAAIVVMLIRHRKKMPDYFSYTSITMSLKWLQWIMVCFFISYSFVYLSLQMAPSLLRHPMLDPRMTPDIALTFFIIVFGFFSLRQPLIYREPERQEGEGEDQGGKKYEKSGLKSDDADRYLQILMNFMEKEKPYLDPDLTIIDLSERLNIPRHHLTQVINERLEKNFYLFVNEYRIREAKEIMGDPEFSDHTILRIAFDSGFNSKSVFNSIFKKLTNHTPTEYRLARGAR